MAALRAPVPTQLLRTRRVRVSIRTNAVVAQQSNQSKVSKAVKAGKASLAAGAATTLGVASPALAEINELLGIDVSDLFAPAPKKGAPSASPAPAAPEIELPKLELPDMPKLEMPKMELPSLPEVPTPKPVPQVELPEVPTPKPIPKVELPEVPLKTVQKQPEITLPELKAPEIGLPEVELPDAKDLFGNFSKGLQKEFQAEFGGLIPKSAPKAPEAPKLPEVPKMPEMKLPEVPTPKPVPEVPAPKPVPEVPAPKAFVPEVPEPKPVPTPEPIKVEAPQIELPSVELPEMPKVEMPKVELPKVELPDTSAATNAISGAKSSLLTEFNKEFGNVLSGVEGVKGAGAGAAAGAKASVDGALSQAAAEVGKYLPAELNDLLQEAAKNQDLAAAVAAVFVGGPLLTVVFLKLIAISGYAGEKTPEEVLKGLQRSNSLLIDTRSERELISQGVPDLRGGARSRVRVIEPEPLDNSVRRELNNPSAVEVQIFAAKVKALASGRREIYVLDAGGSSSKALARAISRQGVRAFTVKGGFKAWEKSGMMVKDNYNVTLGQYISEETDNIASPIVKGAGESVSSLVEEASDPTVLAKYGAGIVASAFVVYNYELVLEYLGVLGLLSTAAVKTIKAEGGVGEQIATLRATATESLSGLSGSLESAKSSLASASELASKAAAEAKAKADEAKSKTTAGKK